MKLYLWIDARGDLELPLAVADTPRELAKIAGTTPNVVRSSVSKWKKGETKKSKFQIVEI